MTSFSNVTVGQQVEFNQILANAGFTDLDMQRIIKDPILASIMYESIHRKDSMFWYVSPEDQLCRAKELWPGVDFPNPPKSFTLETPTQVLLLHVPDTFRNLWNKIKLPGSYPKNLWAWDSTRYDLEGKLYRAHNKKKITKPTWVAFDPEHGKGQNPELFLNRTDHAGDEVLSALIQFPEWALSWLIDMSTPTLPALRVEYEKNKLTVPSLKLWDYNHNLDLVADYTRRNNNWSCLTARIL